MLPLLLIPAHLVISRGPCRTTCEFLKKGICFYSGEALHSDLSFSKTENTATQNFMSSQ